MTPSNDPRLIKGAFVTLDLADPNAREETIEFQYNPQQLTHTLTTQLGTPEGLEKHAKSVWFKGAPTETFSLDIELDASDHLPRGDGNVGQEGIYPLLSSLEMLAYPRSERVSKQQEAMDRGELEIAGKAFEMPLILFKWGNRALPVSVTSVTVTEMHFDTQLNPLVARVTMQLKALTYSDLDPRHKGYSLFMAYQKSKERMAGEPLSKPAINPPGGKR